jgi:1-acyl-sn-glycerol-3-phosphate acyltransferase
MAALGFAAVAIPLHLLLRKHLADAPENIRAQGWPIRLMQVLFVKYVLRWIDVEGMENLPQGSYLVAANHAYKSGVDGFILGHLLAACAGRVPRIIITSDNRTWVVRAERWVLHHYGIALLVGDQVAGHRQGTSDAIAAYLLENDRHVVLIFPAGRAIADPVLQLKSWGTGAVVSAMKSRCPVVPVAIGGLRLDWTPETVVLSAIGADEKAPTGSEGPPFRIHVRIGKPVMPSGDPHADIGQLRDAVAELMQRIPGLRSDPRGIRSCLRQANPARWPHFGLYGSWPAHRYPSSPLPQFPGLTA